MGTARLLHVTRGVTAVVGSGGKTTLLATLARELPGTVVLTTTTHILPFAGVRTLLDPSPDEVASALERERFVCVGGRAGEKDHKLVAPACGVEALAARADYVLVEADGARRLPLKAHASWEPVVPAGATQTVLVVGAGGLGSPVREAVHRPEIFCELAGCAAEDPATPELVARVLRAEGLATRVLVNQADTPALLAAAGSLAGGLDVPVVAGSLRAGRLTELRG
ncbi:selenium cofactor biosynthesis protein YqeC [Olsenella profusa]|uniref:Selenium-dependent hydroxylase accessory protein YqeC n=1 Tax=Olsenella profusa TaxID=138595 RepID=A0ABS2F4Y9_9ACTN|nr:selenium cofactor biosynthesis protein YqeC [Olsenella profusa]MBM6775643.1 putative selenium-dependent hydroxylase accessory protein YqeC [Olsenella profusa]